MNNLNIFRANLSSFLLGLYFIFYILSNKLVSLVFYLLVNLATSCKLFFVLVKQGKKVSKFKSQTHMKSPLLLVQGGSSPLFPLKYGNVLFKWGYGVSSRTRCTTPLHEAYCYQLVGTGGGGGTYFKHWTKIF